MPIEMPRGLPFSVDTWSPSSKMKKRHHFLTHAHKDHSSGISSHSSYPIYSTHLTKTLLLQYYPQLDGSMFLDIEVGQSVVIDDPDGSFTVTALDANHCPGAVMFLFEGHFGNILHTGDCRLTPECLQSLAEKYVGRKGKKPRCQLDYVFLDCTFGKFSQKMPSKHSAICQEEILVGVSRTFGSKIFVDKAANPEFFQALTLISPEIISEDSSSRFRMFDGFPKLYERAQAKLAEARANLQTEPLIVRPSAQWYACEEGYPEAETQKKQRFNEAVRDQFGVWHVCYSMHSSREELEWALQLLSPKWVVSTTPSCRAMELSYVRKNCLVTQIPSDDPLWKLLDIGVEASLYAADESVNNVSCSPVVEQATQNFAISQLHTVKVSTGQKKLFSLSPLSKMPPVTLFGRARLGLQSSTSLHEQKKTLSIEENLNPLQNVTNQIEKEFSYQKVEVAEVVTKKSVENKQEVDVTEVQSEKSVENKQEVDVTEVQSEKSLENKLEVEVTGVQCKKSLEKETEVPKGSLYTPSGSSKNFNESLRKLYRSINVPVPRPLPSLVELMNANKRARKRFEL